MSSGGLQERSQLLVGERTVEVADVKVTTREFLHQITKGVLGRQVRGEVVVVEGVVVDATSEAVEGVAVEGVTDKRVADATTEAVEGVAEGVADKVADDNSQETQVELRDTGSDGRGDLSAKPLWQLTSSWAVDATRVRHC